MKLDWDATWRNWCRRDAEIPRRPARPARKPTIPEWWMEDMGLKRHSAELFDIDGTAEVLQ